MNFEVPSELDMLMAFDIKPIESKPLDGYWCYNIKDNFGFTLRLSFNAHAGFIHTSLLVQGNSIASITNEGALYLRVKKIENFYVLEGRCQYKGAVSTLRILTQPRIHVTWNTITE